MVDTYSRAEAFLRALEAGEINILSIGSDAPSLIRDLKKLVDDQKDTINKMFKAAEDKEAAEKGREQAHQLHSSRQHIETLKARMEKGEAEYNLAVLVHQLRFEEIYRG